VAKFTYRVEVDTDKPRGKGRVQYYPGIDFTHHPKSYPGEAILIPGEKPSDGATGAIDTADVMQAVFIHDQICKHPFFISGRKITNWMASRILTDQMIIDGVWWRAWYFFWATFLKGCKLARKNGMFWVTK
jgi:hypothetical protein